jgi:predicted unusual protein kinase regulating ubiquinone biosynthesis (AarF/ABC1/UbiB family)
MSGGAWMSPARAMSAGAWMSAGAGMSSNRGMSGRQYSRPAARGIRSPGPRRSVYARASVIWYILLSVVGLLFLVSVALPVPRRVWAFNLYAQKYFWLWVSDVLRLRLLWLTITGRRAKAARLTRPQLLRMFCEDMGPTFIKFGQIIASSSGMFPDRYVQEFQKVLDRVRPFSFEQALATLDAELGTEKAHHLVDIGRKPLASASIAQVHTAQLDDGTPVVVKVQRPGIIKRCEADMKIMRFMAALVARFKKDAELANPVGIVDDFAATLSEELDFRKEAANLDKFNDIMKELGHKNIKAPVPHHDLTTRKVLVMERFDGVRVDDYDEIRRRGIDGEEKLVAGLRAWFQCVVFYGFFHGDVHAGNLMLLDSSEIGFLDFGIVGRFGERERWLVTDYMIAFATGNYRRLAEIICEMGGAEEGSVDMDAFVKDLGETYGPLLTLSFGEVNYADFAPGIQKTATRHRVKMPKEFILITKQLLYFDRYAKALAPKLNVFTDPRLVLGMMSDIQKARQDYEQKKAAATA